MSASTQRQTHYVNDTVKKLDAATRMVTITYGPVKSLDWPAMTSYGLWP